MTSVVEALELLVLFVLFVEVSMPLAFLDLVEGEFVLYLLFYRFDCSRLMLRAGVVVWVFVPLPERPLLTEPT